MGGTTDLVFFARQVSALTDAERHFTLTPADFETLNPNTRTCPTFRSRRDADINLAMYRSAGVLWRDSDSQNGNPWELRFMAMLHMANDSGLFRTRRDLESANAKLVGNHFFRDAEMWEPLVEAKMVHIFDHRFGTYEGQTTAQENQGKLPEFDESAHADAERMTLPYYWIPKHEVSNRLSGRWNRQWLLGWRDICRSTDQRTVIASLFPRVAVGHTMPLAFSTIETRKTAFLYASLCSFALDYAARQKIGGTHLTYSYFKQLPVIAPSICKTNTRWMHGTIVQDWFLSRVLELTYTAWDLESFAHDVGYDGSPFRWDPDRRFLLRCELDAAFFHLYGLSRDDTDYVMDTFPIVRKNDEKAHGEYRTKRVILEIYDEMAEAARTGKPYKTRLDPPPADPRVAHPSREGQIISSPRPAPAPTPKPAIEPERDPMPAVACAIPALVDDGSWKFVTNKPDIAALFSLAAVLLASGKPVPSWQALMAALLVIDAKQATSHLSKDAAAQWKKAVGADTGKKWDPLKLDAALEKALIELRFRQSIELKGNRISALSNLAADPPDALYLGRADFILKHVLSTLNNESLGKLKVLFPMSLRDAPDFALQA
jgi:hypothetical protein